MSLFGEDICIAVYGKSILEFGHMKLPQVPSLSEGKKLEVLLLVWDLERDLLGLEARFGKEDPVAAYFRPHVERVKAAYDGKDDVAFKQALWILLTYAQIK
jgi:hypothetical protein